MISPNEFVEKWKNIWEEELIKFSPDTLEGLDIDEEAKRFLIEAGLPDSAAPELNFKAGLPSICEEFGQAEEISLMLLALKKKYFSIRGIA